MSQSDIELQDISLNDPNVGGVQFAPEDFRGISSPPQAKGGIEEVKEAPPAKGGIEEVLPED